MSKKTSGAAADAPQIPEKYEEIVVQLNGLVEKLESGGLSLEEAVTAFEAGIRLARAGAGKLDEAEKRVEVLLKDDSVEDFEGQ